MLVVDSEVGNAIGPERVSYEDIRAVTWSCNAGLARKPSQRRDQRIGGDVPTTPHADQSVARYAALSLPCWGPNRMQAIQAIQTKSKLNGLLLDRKESGHPWDFTAEDQRRFGRDSVRAKWRSN